MNIGIPPASDQRYRKRYMKFWNEDLENELKYATEVHARPSTSTSHGYGPDLSNEGIINQFPLLPTPKTKPNSYEIIKNRFGTTHSNSEQNSPNNHPLSVQTPSDQSTNIVTGSTSHVFFYIFCIIIIIFVIINLVFLTIFVWKKWRKFQQKLKQSNDETIYDKTIDDNDKRIKQNEFYKTSNIAQTQKSTTNDLYELVKISNYSGVQGKESVRLPHSGTLDAHAKVVDWIAHDIDRINNERLNQPENSSYWLDKNYRENVGKISVGIDATPQGRSNSVLNQVPIEITKEKLLYKTNKDDRFSSDSYENITSFIEDDGSDVPSRENYALLAIQKQNLPKVLPDFSENEMNNTALKRRSLPLHAFYQTQSLQAKIPPTPPPRTTSTLGRKPSTRRNSINITTSPLKLAEEPPDLKEPEISLNVLHVGPLIPKSDSLYSTITRKRPVSNNENLERTSQSTIQNKPNQNSDIHIRVFTPESDTLDKDLDNNSTDSSDSSSNKTVKTNH